MTSVQTPARTGRAAVRPAGLLLGFVLLLGALSGGGFAAGSLVGPAGPGPAGPEQRPVVDELVVAVRLARRTLATIRTNLVWAFGYHAALLPLAAAGLLTPMVAALAMSASSVLVVANSLRLRAWQPVTRGSGRARPGR